MSKCFFKLWPTATEPNCRTEVACSSSSLAPGFISWRCGYLAEKRQKQNKKENQINERELFPVLCLNCVYVWYWSGNYSDIKPNDLDFLKPFNHKPSINHTMLFLGFRLLYLVPEAAQCSSSLTCLHLHQTCNKHVADTPAPLVGRRPQWCDIPAGALAGLALGSAGTEVHTATESMSRVYCQKNI